MDVSVGNRWRRHSRLCRFYFSRIDGTGIVACSNRRGFVCICKTRFTRGRNCSPLYARGPKLLHSFFSFSFFFFFRKSAFHVRSLLVSPDRASTGYTLLRGGEGNGIVDNPSGEEYSFVLLEFKREQGQEIARLLK